MPRSVRSRTPGPRQGLMRFALLAVALIVTIVGAIFAALIVSGRAAHREALNAQALEVRIDHLNELQRNVLTLEMALRGYLLTGEPSFAGTYEESRREIGPLLRTVRGETGADQRSEAAELAGAIGDYLTGSADGRRRHGLTLSPVDLAEASRAAKLQIDAIRERFAALLATERRLAAQRRAVVADTGSRAIRIAVIGFGVSIALMLAFALYLRQAVLAPLRAVVTAVGRVTAGERAIRVPAAGAGEAAVLGETFNAMADTLDARERDLAERDRLEGILRHATAAIEVKDLDGRYLIVNRRWEEQFGLRART